MTTQRFPAFLVPFESLNIIIYIHEGYRSIHSYQIQIPDFVNTIILQVDAEVNTIILQIDAEVSQNGHPQSKQWPPPCLQSKSLAHHPHPCPSHPPICLHRPLVGHITSR